MKTLQALDRLDVQVLVRGFVTEENEAITPDTVQDLVGLDLRHCTGWRAVTAMANRFGDAVVTPPEVGKSFTF
ncbi:MAG TPA: hypothetical protein VLI93_01580 [Acetobacteraceae bacterium]|nr:hypothetical protein [Acetobacteraceae bacterium]